MKDAKLITLVTLLVVLAAGAIEAQEQVPDLDKTVQVESEIEVEMPVAEVEKGGTVYTYVYDDTSMMQYQGLGAKTIIFIFCITVMLTMLFLISLVRMLGPDFDLEFNHDYEDDDDEFDESDDDDDELNNNEVACLNLNQGDNSRSL